MQGCVQAKVEGTRGGRPGSAGADHGGRTIDDAVLATVFRVVAGLVAGVAALVGVLAVVHGLRRGATDRELARTGTRTSGVVVDNQLHSSTAHRPTSPDGVPLVSGGGVTFSPVVRFTDSTGHDHVVAGQERANSSWVTGTTVQVLYDPDRPDRVAVGTSRSGPVVAVAVGLLMVAFAVAVVAGVGATAGWTGDPTSPDQFQVPGGGPGDLPPGFDQLQPAAPGT